MPFNIEDYLNSLPLDTTVIVVSNQGLTYLPDLSRFKQLRVLICSYNHLRELPPLNNNLDYLYCSDNQLTELPFLNNKLKYLECSYNQLRLLPPLNNNLTDLYCHHNQLTWLPPLNNNLKYLNCFYNYNNTNIIKILRNFRYTYYLLKYKKHFKRWLWEKVREPKVMAKFHPDHLTNLEDTDDLEVFLEDWIKK